MGTAADRASTRMLLAAEFLFREMNTREGYALWAASYDQEQNALIAVEEPLVDALLAELSFADVLDVGSGTGRPEGYLSEAMLRGNEHKRFCLIILARREG